MESFIKFGRKLSFGSQMLHFVKLQAANWARGCWNSQSASVFNLGLKTWCYELVFLFTSLLFGFYVFLRLIVLCCSDISPYIWHTKGASKSPLHPHHFLPTASLLSAIFLSIVFPEMVSYGSSKEKWDGNYYSTRGKMCKGKSKRTRQRWTESWRSKDQRWYEREENKAPTEPVQPLYLLSCNFRLHKH